MVRKINRLSARKVESIAEIGRHADGGNLYLSISPNGGKRWTFLFRWHGKPTELGFGSARDVSLARARQLAVGARAKLAEGIKPVAPRRAAEGSTFGDVADAVIEAMRPSWRSAKHAAQWETSLQNDAAPLRRLPVQQIATEDVLLVLKPLWTTKRETASRLRGRIERVLDAAKAKGLRTGENPARWRGHLDQLLAGRQRVARKHLAAMVYSDVPAFMDKLRERESIATRALEFAILGAARAGEVRFAVWDEFDIGAATWIIPPARMKGGREHRVPLSPRAVEIVAKLRESRTGNLVFPGQKPGKPLSDMALEMVLRRMKAGDVTVHGFRSSFRDWAAERTNFPREIAEKALAHLVGDETERAYQRGDLFDKRRELMEEWAQYCGVVAVYPIGAPERWTPGRMRDVTKHLRQLYRENAWPSATEPRSHKAFATLIIERFPEKYRDTTVEGLAKQLSPRVKGIGYGFGN